ncbi:MAG TPA: ABC transporter permease [Methylomirabilota bacterium]|jgi:ABC-type dipeptide/oligopeptide/nickel transport system permease component|nr:ABC transporter permease [Methylomirabilota bacterium]
MIPGRYLAARLLASLPILLGVTLAVFVAMRLIPGDPALIFAGDRATAADIERLRGQLGLDRPLYVQYGIFVGHLARGDLGLSIRSGRPVSLELHGRLGNTLTLAVAAIAVTVAVGVPLGIAAAVRRRTWLDRASLFLSLIGITAPAFVIGVLLQLVFAVRLGLFPTAGAGSLWHLVLPALTLGAFPVANVARLTRANMLEVLGQDYVRTARSKGLAERAVVWRHALRNALIPTVTVVGLQLGYMLGGAVLVEVVFAWPGLGRFLVQSIASRDYPAVQGAVLLIAVGYLVINVVVDVLYAVLDPRIRYGA